MAYIELYEASDFAEALIDLIVGVGSFLVQVRVFMAIMALVAFLIFIWYHTAYKPKKRNLELLRGD